MTDRIPKEDLLKFLAGDETSLPKSRRDALEAELDRKVDEAVDAMPRIEPTPAFDRALFAKIDEIDQQAQASILERFLGALVRPSLPWAAGFAAAAVVLVVVLVWKPTDGVRGSGTLTHGDTLELAENLDLYEDLDVIENLDVLHELELIESLEGEAG